MNLKHDKVADAIYIKLSNMPYAYGKDLDDLRRIDYDSEGNPMGIELLCVSGGANLDGLPNKNEIAEVLEASRIKIYEMQQYSYSSMSGSANVIFEVRMDSPAEREREKHTAGLKQEITV